MFYLTNSPVVNDVVQNEHKILYLVVIIVIFMIIDFITSSLIRRFFRLLYSGKNVLPGKVSDQNYLVNIKLFSRLTVFLTRLALITVAVMVALSVFGIGVATFLASAGFVGILITIALGDLIRDLISGFIILKDKYIVVGDKVNIDGFEGIVVAVNTRTTILKNDNNEQMIIYNRLIAKIIKKEGE